MTKIQPAERLQLVQEYYFSRKLKEVARLNAEGRDIISLAIGSPDMPPSPQTIDRLCEVAHQPGAHGYQPTMGTPELREAMSYYYNKVYGVDVDPQTEVLPLIGSKEGILHITLAFVNPGETVLVPNPGYPTYTSLSKLLGARVEYYDLKEENGWQPDFDDLFSRDLSHVKLMWSNYPHMPTGARALQGVFDRLAELARKNNFIVVNDNPYSRILNDSPLSIFNTRLTNPQIAKDYCIELNSLSKSHNMPGWRVGMCIAKAEYISWILKVKSNIDSGTFRGLQLAAAEALTTNTEEWHVEHNIQVYRRRRALAEQIMTTLGCTYDPQQVGMFLWGRIPDQYENAEQLTERVLHEARVFITPGFIFGSNGERYIRISLCAKEEKMREALERVLILRNQGMKE
ncbi:MAG: aminotransferase class I/II-fold pyridoxal phosphate-dependent enzyme [Prevotella sp.]|nr:aminotransferase class I/II-fold pyridoxal phosphate-dependent enzyme [Prevotella sp.]